MSQEEAEAAAAAAEEHAVAEQAPTVYQVVQEAATLTNENKWSKNGYGEPCARTGGKFTREETETVRRAVEEYCALKNIETARLCSECDHKAELKGAWMEIAKSLPHRTVQSVYRHGLRQLHPFKRGPWTESECQALLELVTRMGKKWSAIQAKLNRSADSCRDKYREMSSEYVKGRWKDGETEILKRLIREHLRADPNADIKELGKMVEREGIVIPWSTISKKMTKRSRLSCFKKWQKMTGMFSPSDQKLIGQEASAAAAATTTAVLGAATGTAEYQPQATTTAVPTAVSATTLSAPTAGAAAAAAAKQAVANPMDLLATPAAAAAANSGPEVVREYDLYLLQLLVSSGATREEEVEWSSYRLSGDPQARWNALVDEWQDAEADENLLDLPLSEIAKIMLEQKQQEGDAKMAAETVEAVELPNVPLKRGDGDVETAVKEASV